MNTEQQNTPLPKGSIQQASIEEIEQSQEAITQWWKLQKINDILEGLNLPKVQEAEYRQNLLKQNVHFLDQVLSKNVKERLAFLIQSQINELENSDNPNFDKLDELQKHLIARQKSEIQRNDRKIDSIQKTNQKLDELRDTLLLNNSLSQNSHIQEIRILFNQIDKNWEVDQKWKRTILQNIIDKLKSPWTLESIAQSLWWTNTKEYQTFKTQLLTIEPSLQESFYRVDIKLLSSIAQVKLWTNNIDGVKLDQDILTKSEGNILIEVWDTARNISLSESDYKLSSTLNPKYETQITSLYQKASKELQPMHEKQWVLCKLLNLIQCNGKKSKTLDGVKKQIQAKYPTLYSKLGLSTQTSLDAITAIITTKLTQLQKKQALIYERTQNKIDLIVSISTKEAQEKDKYKKNMLEFLHSIGFDILSQEKTNTIIEYINLNPQQYGLQSKIDFENSEIGFNKDFWKKELSTTEKQWFIQLFNQILWEPIIDENIARKITSLNPEAIMRLQVLNNKMVGYFLENLEKIKIST